MSIIRSSKTFAGGEFKQGGGSYIKSGIKVMNFRDKQFAEGSYVFILEAYKEDSDGNGVWYNPIKIRDNFGLDIKEKFAVQPNCPVDYFASKIKTYAPNMAKVEKVKGEDGRDRNVYPAFGRTTWRVLYNAAFFQNPEESGVHVLDLPQSGGASVIYEFVNGKQPDGSDNPRINDYQAAIPVHIKLDLKAAGQPWKIQINNSKTYHLPTTLADSDYLYNLDEVVAYPTKAELIEKLKMIVPTDIFNKCMSGYSDGSVAISMATPTNIASTPPLPTREEDDVPWETPKPARASVPVANKPSSQSVAPAFSLPKLGTAKVATVPEANETDDLPRPPVSPTAAIDVARQFLKRPTA